jgi:hypothetical protein
MLKERELTAQQWKKMKEKRDDGKAMVRWIRE